MINCKKMFDEIANWVVTLDKNCEVLWHVLHGLPRTNFKSCNSLVCLISLWEIALRVLWLFEDMEGQLKKENNL